MAKDLTGKKFGRLTVRGYVRMSKCRQLIWECVCSCGKVVQVRGNSLKPGKTRSCGCLKAELAAERLRTHGASKTPEHQAWENAQDRCINANNKRYSDYGGRGITMCDRWRASFENFLHDMGMRPSSKHSLDREDNDGNYCPENCRWATKTEQDRNKRSNRMLTYDGRTQCVVAWAEELGINPNTVRARLRSGWPVEQCLSTPVRKRSTRKTMIIGG